jgi:hypothetical protein
MQADQGFLTSFFDFKLMINSPMFDASARCSRGGCDLPMMRINPGYNLNVRPRLHFLLSVLLRALFRPPFDTIYYHLLLTIMKVLWYYEKGSWGLYRQDKNQGFAFMDPPGFSLAFCVPPLLKPWFW